MGANEAHLFVYGTLLPGDVRWPILEPFAIDEGAADAVRGLLFDTGLDYPAAVFDPDADALVLGRRYRLRPDTLDEALVRLDVEEDVVLGLYRVGVSIRRRPRTDPDPVGQLVRPAAALNAQLAGARYSRVTATTAPACITASSGLSDAPSSMVNPVPLAVVTVRDHCDAVPV